ncbi:MAG TPA: HD domain-containing protein [Isosphaeraceae bacterium]
MHDKYKRAHRSGRSDDRLRIQIAREAARRLLSEREASDASWLDALTEADFYTAKRKAAAVLGHRVRPGDLPSDSEVRTQVVSLRRSPEPAHGPMPEPDDAPGRMADVLDRFTVYRVRLAPLESVKQKPPRHPEGDALYHSLQVFELARDVRPYDEEFLLAALLHDVGKGLDPSEHIASAVEALRGSVTERTLWLIAHHHDLDDSPRAVRPTEPAEWLDDLRLLHELDLAGRVVGRHVEGLDAALAYIRGLESEDYLDE